MARKPVQPEFPQPTLHYINPESIEMGKSVRKRDDDISMDVMFKSIQRKGVQSPLHVRPMGDGRYKAVAGGRRLKAALLAGLKVVPCIVVESAEDHADDLETQLVENVCRADLDPIDRAEGFQDLMTLRGWSARELADNLGLAPSTVTRSLELLEASPEIQALVENGDLPASTAIEVAKLPEEEQVVIAGRIGKGEPPPKRKDVREGGSTPLRKFTWTTLKKWTLTMTQPRGMKRIPTEKAALKELKLYVEELSREMEGDEPLAESA